MFLGRELQEAAGSGGPGRGTAEVLGRQGGDQHGDGWDVRSEARGPRPGSAKRRPTWRVSLNAARMAGDAEKQPSRGSGAAVTVGGAPVSTSHPTYRHHTPTHTIR